MCKNLPWQDCQSPEEEILLITGLLRYVGEFFKTTTNTPNLSERTKNLLIQSSPQNLITTFSSLRNLLNDPNLIEGRCNFLSSGNNCKKILRYLPMFNKKIEFLLDYEVAENSLIIIEQNKYSKQELNGEMSKLRSIMLQR